MKPGKKNCPSAACVTSTSASSQPNLSSSRALASLESGASRSMAAILPSASTAMPAEWKMSRVCGVWECTKVPSSSSFLCGDI